MITKTNNIYTTHTQQKQQVFVHKIPSINFIFSVKMWIKFNYFDMMITQYINCLQIIIELHWYYKAHNIIFGFLYFITFNY